MNVCIKRKICSFKQVPMPSANSGMRLHNICSIYAMRNYESHRPWYMAGSEVGQFTFDKKHIKKRQWLNKAIAYFFCRYFIYTCS